MFRKRRVLKTIAGGIFSHSCSEGDVGRVTPPFDVQKDDSGKDTNTHFRGLKGNPFGGLGE